MTFSTTLSATYASPQSSSPTVLSHQIPADGASNGAATADLASSTGTRTAYLHELRAHVVRLQGQINDFLTQKMAEDNERAAAVAGADKAKAEAEARKEEENYGEELVEED